MSKLVQPHGGGSLKPLLLPEVERKAELKRAATLKKVPMTSRETSDVIMLAMGAYTPLDGFMGKADWQGVCANMKHPPTACSGRSPSPCPPPRTWPIPSSWTKRSPWSTARPARSWR